MFDIGFLEMMTIGIVALLVIGPERLPEVAAKVGRYVGKAQRFVRGVRSDISRELESGDLKKLIGDQKDQIDELRKMVHTATKDIESSTSGALKDAQSSVGELKSELNNSLSDSGGTAGASVKQNTQPEQLNSPDDTSATNNSGTADASDADQQQNNKAS